MTGIKKYSVLGRYSDVEIDIRLAADRPCCSSSRTSPGPQSRSATWCSAARPRWACPRLPAALDQALSQYTSDNGDHVQLVVVRVTPELSAL